MFEQYVAAKKAEGKTQIVVRCEDTIAWASGFASYLMSKFNTRKLNERDDFVAYI